MRQLSVINISRAEQQFHLRGGCWNLEISITVLINGSGMNGSRARAIARLKLCNLALGNNDVLFTFIKTPLHPQIPNIGNSIIYILRLYIYS